MLEQRLEADSQAAMRGKLPELGVLRLLRAALKNEEIAKRGSVWDEAGVLAVLRRELKKRQESAKLYEQAARPELMAAELQEAKVIERYLPPAPSAEVIEEAAAELAAHLKLAAQKSMGQLVKAIMAHFDGACDGGSASAAARKALGLG